MLDVKRRSVDRLAGALTLAGVLLVGLGAGAVQRNAREAEARAIAFLAVEIPRWPAENNCYSCHNNGDAARALYAAIRDGHRVDRTALQTTTAWLEEPGKWDANASGRDFSDTALARIQFAGALVDAMDAGLVSDRRALAQAAELVAQDQQPDGSWRLDSSGSIGSPATYGTALATWAALRTLRRAGLDPLKPIVDRGARWIRELEVKTVLDAAAILLALDHATDEAALEQRQHGLSLIIQGRAPSGGWGAYVTSATEPFDTAVVLLALRRLWERPDLASPAMNEDQLRTAIQDGRAFLVERQLNEGGWPETTRPPGQQSYAQYVSTTGWVTLALLETNESP